MMHGWGQDKTFWEATSKAGDGAGSNRAPSGLFHFHASQVGMTMSGQARTMPIQLTKRVSPAPRRAKEIEARICWLSPLPLDARVLPATRFLLKHTTRSVKARLISINSRVDVEMKAIAQELEFDLHLWSVVDGLVDAQTEKLHA